VATRTAQNINGEEVVVFSDEEVKTLAQPFIFTLVGFFINPRPTLREIEGVIRKVIKPSEKFFPAAVDAHHILIIFLNEADFLKTYLHGHWNIAGRAMRLSRWSPYFEPNIQSPLLPVWVGLPGLRTHFHSPGAIRSIISPIGRFLKVHENVISFTRLGIAMICVEVDFLKPLVHEVKIQNGKEHIIQPMLYPEPTPEFCNQCWKFGHHNRNCQANS
jgi:hypothetical protein